MANEIVELTRETTEDGVVRVRALFLYPLSPPIQIDGTNVVLTHSDQLPPLVLGYNLVTQQEKAALDAGAGFFLLEWFEQSPGETLIQLLNRVRAHYTMRGEEFETRWRSALENAGTRYNAP